MKPLIAIVLIAASAVSTGAAAQKDSNVPATGCPATAQELPTQALYGSWEARFDDLPGIATVELGKHPDYEGVRGTIARRSAGAIRTAQLAGDIDDEGLLTIDESEDGRSISGVWSGHLQPGACGKEFRGIWRDAANDSTHPFVLHKTGQWATTQ